MKRYPLEDIGMYFCPTFNDTNKSGCGKRRAANSLHGAQLVSVHVAGREGESWKQEVVNV